MPSTLPCQYYWGDKGRYGCQSGDKCTFSHDVSPTKFKEQQDKMKQERLIEEKAKRARAMAPRPLAPQPTPTPITTPPPSGPGSIPSMCRFYSTTCSCVVGLAFPTSPPPKPTPKPSSSSTPNPTCAICCEEIINSRFGVLQNCFHTFHYKCLKNWRSEGASSKQSLKSCPLCRAPSHFIVPSTSAITTASNKNTLIAAFKLNCSKKICATFSQTGSCPFQASCFYKHINAKTGAAALPSSIPRVRLDDEGLSTGVSNIKISDFLS
ncbi:hypothetical protein TrLO_g1348 [Triparma laevis f. longispina]|uniref:RING-type E3 ubiquitin transferase n=1 Tax=Triparma laevis f. longispina TaxID=1714387 RepID=A0A9W7KXL5_9STRA|nr:hypothetical protein TrLO_g1348 [Triparma laevis f. longispina]